MTSRKIFATAVAGAAIATTLLASLLWLRGGHGPEYKIQLLSVFLSLRTAKVLGLFCILFVALLTISSYLRKYVALPLHAVVQIMLASLALAYYFGLSMIQRASRSFAAHQLLLTDVLSVYAALGVGAAVSIHLIIGQPSDAE